MTEMIPPFPATATRDCELAFKDSRLRKTPVVVVVFPDANPRDADTSWLDVATHREPFPTSNGPVI